MNIIEAFQHYVRTIHLCQSAQFKPVEIRTCYFLTTKEYPDAFIDHLASQLLSKMSRIHFFMGLTKRNGIFFLMKPI